MADLSSHKFHLSESTFGQASQFLKAIEQYFHSVGLALRETLSP